MGGNYFGWTNSCTIRNSEMMPLYNKSQHTMFPMASLVGTKWILLISRAFISEAPHCSQDHPSLQHGMDAATRASQVAASGRGKRAPEEGAGRGLGWVWLLEVAGEVCIDCVLCKQQGTPWGNPDSNPQAFIKRGVTVRFESPWLCKITFWVRSSPSSQIA